MSIAAGALGMVIFAVMGKGWAALFSMVLMALGGASMALTSYAAKVLGLDPSSPAYYQAGPYPDGDRSATHGLWAVRVVRPRQRRTLVVMSWTIGLLYVVTLTAILTELSAGAGSSALDPAPSYVDNSVCVTALETSLAGITSGDSPGAVAGAFQSVASATWQHAGPAVTWVASEAQTFKRQVGSEGATWATDDMDQAVVSECATLVSGGFRPVG